MRLSIVIINICLFLCFFSIYTNAEDLNIDSLRMSVQKMPDDTSKVIELAKLSKIYAKYQVDTACIIGQKAFMLAQKLEYKYGEGYSFFILGIVNKYASKYDLSITYLNHAYQIFDSLNDEAYKARALNSLGNDYKKIGEYSTALENFMGALDISKSNSDTILIAALYNNIANLYSTTSEYDKALEYQFQNLSLKKKLNLKEKIPIVLMTIGNLYREKKDYSQALSFYSQALELSGDLNNKYDRLLLIDNIAKIYSRLGKYNIAKKYYMEAMKMSNEIGSDAELFRALVGLGEIYTKTNKFKEGEKYLLESYKLANKINNYSTTRWITYLLKETYKNNGNYRESLKYMELYQELEDSVFNINYINAVSELEQKYKAKEREQEIAFLEKEQAIQKLELSKKEVEAKQKSFQRNVLILISLLAVSLLVYYLKDNKKRRKLNVLLVKQNKKIIDQRAEIAKQNDELLESNKTKDKLFQIIAHDLRSPLVSMDSITQLIPYWVEEQDYKSLKKLSKSLELSVNNVLSLIDNLLNWALNQQGKFPYKPENLRLKKNINEAIEVYKPIADIKNINLKFKASKDVIVFADRNMLFTVMRNLLNNAVKFTPENGEIIVAVNSNQQFAKVSVKDSGVGISKDKKDEVFELANGTEGTKGETGKGLGLFFCKEFVNMNNGDIFIESETGKGTTITFTLPLFNLVEN